VGAAANAINNSGQVAGSLFYFPFPASRCSPPAGYQEFAANSTGLTVVPTPSGWAGARAYSINNSGQVAGFVYKIAIGQTGCQEALGGPAFIGTGTGSTLIPVPAGASGGSVGTQSINDLAIIVGYSEVGGWIWDATGGTRLLTSLVPPGWSVSNAISISNNGLILAQASYQGGASQYVELIPAGLAATPAPSTLSLILIGAVLCSVLWAHNRRLFRKA
jgi:uncharacterized membrane protein